MYKRLIAVAAAAAFVMAVSPALSRAQDRDTATRSRGAFLGIAAESTPQNAEHQGATVRDVTPNGPAAKAGLKRGDIITKVDDKEIHDFEDLLNVLSQHRPSQKVKIEAMRNGQEKELTVTLGQQPSQQSFRSNDRGEFRDEEDRGGSGYYSGRRQSAFLGVQTGELTPNARNRDGISAQHGVVVTEVLPNTPAEQAGLQEGDVITRVNDQDISSPEDLRKAIQSAGAGREVQLDVMRGRRHQELTARLEQGSAEFGGQFGREYGVSPMEQNREIQRLQQRIQQLERRLRRLEQNRQYQESP
jgi:S1-C subfamily serine protease